MNTIIKSTNEQIAEAGNTYGADPSIVQPYINENKELVYPIKEIDGEEEVVTTYRSNGTKVSDSQTKAMREILIMVRQSGENTFNMDSLNNFGNPGNVTVSRVSTGDVEFDLSELGVNADKIRGIQIDGMIDNFGLLEFGVTRFVEADGDVVRVRTYKTTISDSKLVHELADVFLDFYYIRVLLKD